MTPEEYRIICGGDPETGGPRYPYVRRTMQAVWERLAYYAFWLVFLPWLLLWAAVAFAHEGTAPQTRACAPECPFMCQDAPGEPDARWPVCAVPLSTNDAREETE